jgi:hypothetical protein
MPCEFDCAECGRHVMWFTMAVTEPPLCAACLALPGWFRDPTLARIIDREHDRDPPEERDG